jgi:hypothetical protein
MIIMDRLRVEEYLRQAGNNKYFDVSFEVGSIIRDAEAIHGDYKIRNAVNSN